MRTSAQAYAKRHPLGAFFALAYAFSWGYWAPVALAGGHWSHFPGLMGPMASALVVTTVVDGRAGLGRMLGRMAHWRAPWHCYAAAAVPVAVALLAVGAMAGVGADVPSFAEMRTMPGLPSVGWLAVLVLVFVVNGYGEETGWRGFAWPALRQGRSTRDAALVLAGFWATWHLPTFWIDSGMRGFPVLFLPGFLIGLASGAVVLGRLYERSGGSLPAVALWHTLLNMTSATEGAEGFVAMAVTAAVIFWAVRILRLETTLVETPA